MSRNGGLRRSTGKPDLRAPAQAFALNLKSPSVLAHFPLQ